MSTSTFTQAVNDYLKTADWITDGHPVAFGLREAAKELDAKWVTSLWAEYNKTIRMIEAMKPEQVETKKVDPLLAPAVPALETRG